MADESKRRGTDSVEELLGEDFVAEFGLLGNQLMEDDAPADEPASASSAEAADSAAAEERSDTAEVPIVDDDGDAPPAAADLSVKDEAAVSELQDVFAPQEPDSPAQGHRDQFDVTEEAEIAAAPTADAPSAPVPTALTDDVTPADIDDSEAPTSGAPIPPQSVAPRPPGPIPDAGHTMITSAPVLPGMDIPKPKAAPVAPAGGGFAPLPPGAGGPKASGPIGRISPPRGAPPTGAAPSGTVPSGSDVDGLPDAFGPSDVAPTPTQILPGDQAALAAVSAPADRADGAVESGSTVISAPAYRPGEPSDPEGMASSVPVEPAATMINAPAYQAPADGAAPESGTQVVDLNDVPPSPGAVPVAAEIGRSGSDGVVDFDPNLTEAGGYRPTPSSPLQTLGPAPFPRATVRRTVDDLLRWLQEQALPIQLAVYAGGAGLLFVILVLPWLIGSGSSYEVAFLVDDYELRAGPGTEHQFQTVARLVRNEELTVIKRGENWVLVQDPFLRVGWLNAEMLSEDLPLSTSDRPFTRCRRRVGEPDAGPCGMRAQVQFDSCSEQCRAMSADPAECITRCSQHQAICAKSCEVAPVQSALETGVPTAAAEPSGGTGGEVAGDAEATDETSVEEVTTVDGEAAPAGGETDGGSVVNAEELNAETEAEPSKKKRKKRKKRRKKRRK